MTKRFVIAIMAMGLSTALAQKTVENGFEPREPGVNTVFSEDLRLGSETGDSMLIWRGPEVRVTVNGQGHMFVVDSAENRIVEIDPAGKPVRQIGKQGEGPGEFQGLDDFEILASGAGIAFENFGGRSYLSFFDTEMNFQNRQQVTAEHRLPRVVDFSPSGFLIASTATSLNRDTFVETTEFGVFNMMGQPLKLFLSWDAPYIRREKMEDPGHWAEFLGGRMAVYSKGYNAFAVFDESGAAVYSARSDKYEIVKWNKDLSEKQMIIARKHRPKPMTKGEIDAIAKPMHDGVVAQLPKRFADIVTFEVIEKAVALADFPDVKFPILGLTYMGDGKIAATHDYNYATRVATVDLFDAEGRFVDQFTRPNNGMERMTVKDGYAYTIETDERDVNHLVRYKLTFKPR